MHAGGIIMLDQLKAVFLILVFVLALLSFPLVLIKGAAWAVEILLVPLVAISKALLLINLAVLLPLSIVLRFRVLTGSWILLSSYVFALLAWLQGFILTYTTLGVLAVLLGLLLFGVGVVPIALIATAVSANWPAFMMLLLVTLLSFVCRLVGAYILSASRST